MHDGKAVLGPPSRSVMPQSIASLSVERERERERAAECKEETEPRKACNLYEAQGANVKDITE